MSLAGGMPNIADLPLNVVGESLHSLVLANGTQAMQYGAGQGEPVLREQICEVMRLEGIEAHPDDVTVTVGSQQGLDLITRIFCDPRGRGDRRGAELRRCAGGVPGRSSARSCTSRSRTPAATATADCPPTALREALAGLRSQGRRVKFIYTIPQLPQPGRGDPRRWSAAARSSRSRVSSTCWWSRTTRTGLLGFDAEPIPAMRALDADRVLYLGSFSKTFAPGFRVGWVLAPHAVKEKLVLAQESAVLCPPVFSQYAVSSYLSAHDWKGQIKVFAELYTERRDAMMAGAPGATSPLAPPGPVPAVGSSCG